MSEPEGGFLAIPTGSSYSAQEGRALSIGPVSGADLRRAHLERGPTEPDWHIYLPPGVDSVTLPQLDPSAGVAVETLVFDRILVNAFDLEEGVDMETLFSSGGSPIEELLSVVERASYIREKITAE